MYFRGSSGFRCLVFCILGGLQVSGVLIVAVWVSLGFRCHDFCNLGGFQVLGILILDSGGLLAFDVSIFILWHFGYPVVRALVFINCPGCIERNAVRGPTPK